MIDSPLDENKRRLYTPDGKLIRRPSAWSIIMDPSTHDVLVAKRSPSARNPNLWNFFGGNIDPGETPLTAALRELREESGIRQREQDVMFSGRIETKKRIIYYFVFFMSQHAPSLNHESSEFKWMPFRQLSIKNQQLHLPTAVIANAPDTTEFVKGVKAA